MNKGHYIISQCLPTQDWYYVTELTKKEKQVIAAKKKEFNKMRTNSIGLSFDEWIKMSNV